MGLEERTEAREVWNSPPQFTSAPAGEFVQVSVGRKFACGIRKNASATCWGQNSAVKDEDVPKDETFTQITAGYQHACGIVESGKAICWGSAIAGQSTVPKDFAPAY